MNEKQKYQSGIYGRAAMRLNDDESIRTGVKYYQTQLASVVEQTLFDF